MTATNRVTTGIDTRVLVVYKSVTTTSFATAAVTATGFDLAADLFPKVSEIGDHGKSGNPIEYGIYGEDTRRKIAGQASYVDFTFSYFEDRSETKHIALLNKAVGSAIAVGIWTRTQVGATTNYGETLAVIQGSISELTKSAPLDAVQTVTVGVALESAPVWLDKA